MEKLKYQILERINHLNYYHRKKIEGIRTKRWFQIGVGVVIILIGIASYFDQITLVPKKPKYFDEIVIFMGLTLIGSSIWVLTRKREDFPTQNLDILTYDELTDYLKGVEKIEEAMLDRSARQIASTFATLIVIVMAIFLPPSIKYFKTGKFDLLGGNITDEGVIISLVVFIQLIGFVIADIIGAPMTPKRYYKEKKNLSNKIVFCFLTNIDNSPINPQKNK